MHSVKICQPKKTMHHEIFTLNRHKKQAELIIFVNMNQGAYIHLTCFHCTHVDVNNMRKEYRRDVKKIQGEID